MISYDAESSVFKLDTKNSTYVIGVNEAGHILNLYYGAYLPDAELWDNAARNKSASFSAADPDIPGESFSCDAAPMEYPTHGGEDMRICALKIRNADGNAVTSLRYESHRIFKGKPDISPLPHIYLNSPDEADTLEITACDGYTGVKAKLRYTVFSRLDAIIKSAELVNEGESEVRLERAMSGCVDLPSMDFDMITLYGRHNKERTTQRCRLSHGIQGIRSIRGASSHNHNPFAALVRPLADENSSEAYGFNLIYSGNFEIFAECDHNCTTRIVCGIAGDDFSWRLSRGESFCTPECVCVYSCEGIGGMSRTFHKLYSNNLISGKYKKQRRPLLINSWEAAYFDFDADKLVEFAKQAKRLGIEMLVMDDGWFGRRNDDTSSLGDWFANEEKLPGGVKALSERIHALGMKFGIWYEPEMISPDSELFRAHPDWHVHVKGRTPSIGRHQYVLDVSRADVRDNIFAQMSKMFSSCDIDYIKWDFNRNLTQAGSALLGADEAGEFYHRFMLGTYELMERFTKAFPNVLFENCSGGGGRFDPGMLYYSPQIWTSDNTDPIERLSIQFGTSLCYPASCMGAHVSACSRTGYETKGNVALWGTFGYELDPTKLGESDRALIVKQTEEYDKYYELIREGELYRLLPPDSECGRAAWSFVSEDKSEALVTVVTVKEKCEAFFILRLAGLCPQAYYMLEDSGKVYSGALLMNAGINLTYKSHRDGQSLKLHLVRVDR